MTLGTAVGLIAIGLAFGAAGARSRDPLCALLAVGILSFTGYAFGQLGLDASRLVATSDELLMVLGLLLAAGTVTLTMGASRSLDDRLFYGRALREHAFHRALLEARRPFIEAAASRHDSMDQKARWRPSVSLQPPNEQWGSLADRLASADEQWTALLRAGSTQEEWLRWQAATDQIVADWEALRAGVVGHGVERARRAARLGSIALAGALGLMSAGAFNATNGLFSGPPSGRADVVPALPPGRTVYLAPLGDAPVADLDELAGFYAERYGLRVGILSGTPIPDEARDATRRQVVAEPLIEALRTAHPEARSANGVVIGITSEDLQIRGRPDWSWAFGYRTEGHLAVLSTARMGPEPGPFGHWLEQARLRKMVTKYIGVLYFGLPQSGDPGSVLYGNILSVTDLDGMGEDF